MTKNSPLPHLLQPTSSFDLSSLPEVITEPVAIPKTIADPIHLLLRSAGDIGPIMVCMFTGMLSVSSFPRWLLGSSPLNSTVAFVTTARTGIPMWLSDFLRI